MKPQSISTLLTFLPALSTTEGDALPVPVVEALFGRLSAVLGSGMLALYANSDADLVKAEWGRGLAGFTPEEFRRGMAATRGNRFAPNLPEFAIRCRPCLDPELAWHEAARAVMGDPCTFAWTHPALRWAAQAFNYELRTSTFEKHRKRWTAEMAEQLARHAWPSGHVADGPIFGRKTLR
jgi:hypothetical protein